ncbi:hypothetical protein VTN96DRAFT_9142 [Rasamsonia emersonii]
MGSQKRQKSALYRRPTQKKAVRDQRDEPRASSSISVKDQMEDKYEDSLSSSSLSDIDDDTLNSLGEEIGISDSPDEDSSTDPHETNEYSSLCPHSEPPGPLHTCVHPHHSRFSAARLPPILFRLDPPSQPKQTGHIFPLREGGKIVTNADGTPLRNFSFLPRYISVQVPGWLLEYWSRTDPRLTYKDIIARMPLEDHAGRTQARRGVETDQIWHNTTMDIEYTPGMTPFRLRAKTLVDVDDGDDDDDDDNAPYRYYPLDTFLENGQRRHVPSPRTAAAINFFYKLAEQALKEGLESWEVLYAKDPAASKHILKTSKKRPSNGRLGSKRVRRLRIASVESNE